MAAYCILRRHCVQWQSLPVIWLEVVVKKISHCILFYLYNVVNLVILLIVSSDASDCLKPRICSHVTITEPRSYIVMYIATSNGVIGLFNDGEKAVKP